MSREAMAIILGRAALDKTFLDKLRQQGGVKEAAKAMKVDLTEDEAKKLENVDYANLQEFNDDLAGAATSMAMIFDKKDA
jgi:hypothetical protein